MKLNKIFLIGAMALGLVACNKNTQDDVQEPTNEKTYVGLSIQFPGVNQNRALPEDYNKTGEWFGRDNIKTITVYMVNATKNKVDKTSFDADQFQGINSNGVLNPKLAVEATAGDKVSAYVVINDFSSKLTSRLTTVSAANFATEFQKAVDAVASDVAKYEDSKDVIVMTNDVLPSSSVSTITVAPNISQADALAGVKNQIKVNVSRVVSRAFLTMDSGASKEITLQGTGKITVNEVKYAVGQSNKKFYPIKMTEYATPDPVYTLESIADYNAFKTTNISNFDNSGLGSAMLSNVIAIANATPAHEDIVAQLNAETTSKFVLPVTHATTYLKGNSTYFEVVASFTPNDDAFADGEKAKWIDNSQPLFLGLNDKKFYTTRDLAKAANGQLSTEYKFSAGKGTMKYIIWLNPDKAYGGSEKITKSPTVRNQVYHAHITGFSEMGLPGNPLNPSDPNNPTDPNDPNNPENPNNPVKPGDDIETSKTYLSVQLSVLQWTVHSYNVNLGNNY